MEYCRAIKEPIYLAQNEMALSQRELIINCAAYGEIGSYVAVFKHIAIALLKLVCEPKAALVEEEIISRGLS